MNGQIPPIWTMCKKQLTCGNRSMGMFLHMLGKSAPKQLLLLFSWSWILACFFNARIGSRSLKSHLESQMVHQLLRAMSGHEVFPRVRQRHGTQKPSKVPSVGQLWLCNH